jgi:hypothetical protein
MPAIKYMPVWMILITLLPGCIDPYTPDIEDDQVSLVVEALITDRPGIHSVTLSTSSPLNDTATLKVEGAMVDVVNNRGGIMEFFEEGEGIYSRWIGQGEIEDGVDYMLRIVTPDGEIYESDPERLGAPSPEVGQVYWQFDTIGTADPDNPLHGIQFYLDLTGQEGDARNYRWVLEETWEYHAARYIQYIYDGTVLQNWPDPFVYTYCWRTDMIPSIFIASTKALETNELKKQPLHFVSEETKRLQIKYSLLVKQYSLSDQAYDYWLQVQKQNQETGGIYETQPDRIPGNIHNANDADQEVLGYFNVSSVTEKRIFVDGVRELIYPPVPCNLDTIDRPENKPPYLPIPFYLISLSPMGAGPPYGVGGSLCFDCRNGGGVIEKPGYWE